MGDAREFDPRYSPEFQRGYEPASRELPREQRELQELRAERLSRPRIAPMPVASVSPVVDTAGGQSNPADGLTADPLDEPDERNDADEESEAPLWRNPYLITLAILGVVLTVGGVTLFRWSVDQVYTGQYMTGTQADARQDWLWVQVAWGLAPLLAIAGALTVLGIFFFLATKWSPRRRDDDASTVDEFDE
ncbi:hypothetical protein [Mycetocola zhadangensis]|uniref:Uncharacterized protein n=1 Tax=Mycetocola zhadangensis TaxID=1164595 RepID=A0A3L7ISI5_9MICO|nr:hypothetical protein [Mycetocola zhadangensis]RLQ81188.1 hypothetical protein D9V28_15760 [Mycetocola zhadangensis]GGF05510.1 hypothetical protein GCM10011313_30820 [Mycetocola zhadangensis]